MKKPKKNSADLEAFVQAIKDASFCVAFTGAGVSTLSGIPDFRSPSGLYSTGGSQNMFELATFRRDPSIYYTAARELLYDFATRKPSIVHSTLAKLEEMGHLKGIITQNVDLLHTKAGSREVYEIHGSPNIHRCLRCNVEKTFEEVVAILKKGDIPFCSDCKQAYKPDITFFGESLPQEAIENVHNAALKADLMIVLGSSLTVYPAASLPETALQNGAKVIIVNAQATHLDSRAYLRFDDLQETFEYIAASL